MAAAFQGTKIRSDRAITQRQKHEATHESLITHNLEQLKVEQYAIWENKTTDVIREGRVRNKVDQLKRVRGEHLQDRRQRLAELLAREQAEYERELKDREETPAQRMERLAGRAWELKKRREDERQKVVQSKLYQQWREGIDDLRVADSKLFELQTLAVRDQQVEEKKFDELQDAREKAIYDALWQQGYQAKIDRELKEQALKAHRQAEATNALEAQLQYKAAQEADDRRAEEMEREAMRQAWRIQEQEAAEQIQREKLAAVEERKKIDEYAAIQAQQKAHAVDAEKNEDRQFVMSVLAREKAMAEQEAAERQAQREKTKEFQEALKVEMARQAESEEELERLQAEEAERQWQKKNEVWMHNEIARRQLLEEVYHDRAAQVEHKNQLRTDLKGNIPKERDMVEGEAQRLNDLAEEQERQSALMRKKNQEELFRQMDFHQVQRHRELQQHAIEQRSAMIAEEKLQRALEAEKRKQGALMAEITQKRQTMQQSSRGLVAPWEK